MTDRPQPTEAERVRAWNEKYAVGTPVIYDDGYLDHHTSTTSEAHMAADTAVVSLKHLKGVYPLAWVSPDLERPAWRNADE